MHVFATWHHKIYISNHYILQFHLVRKNVLENAPNAGEFLECSFVSRDRFTKPLHALPDKDKFDQT